MGKRTWTKEEENFVREKYLVMGNKEIGKKLERSRGSIGIKLFRLKLKRYILDEKKIIEQFTKEKKTTSEIAKQFNVSGVTILNRLKKNNINTSRKGKEFSKEHIKNISLSHIGSKGYWLGKKRSLEDVEKFRKSHLGKKQSEELILKRIKKGKEHYNWQGGITPLTRRRTKGTFWKRIADEIRIRDNNTCRICLLKGNKTKLPVHHIIPFKISQDNSPKNLITLCQSCHMKFENKIKEEGYKYLQILIADKYNYVYHNHITNLKEEKNYETF